MRDVGWRVSARISVAAVVGLAMVAVLVGWCSTARATTASVRSGHAAIATTAARTTTTAAPTSGYAVVDTAGTVATFGGAGYHGEATSAAGTIVAVEATGDARGYWLVSSTGTVYPFGDAVSYGSAHDVSAGAPVVAMAVTRTGKGYWLVSSTGRVFAFGDAASYRSVAGAVLSGTVIAIASTHDSKGYWLATSSGNVVAYGDARSDGSAEGAVSAAPVVAMAATRDGKGYWLVRSSGQVLAFGDAAVYAVSANQTVAGTIASMAVTGDGAGYVLVASDGAVFAFGDATDVGSDVNTSEPPNEPAGFSDPDPAVVGIAYVASGSQHLTSGAVTVSYFGDSTAWLDELYSSTEATKYDVTVADAATPGCGVAGGGELSTSAGGETHAVAACANWAQRLTQALASEHPDVVVVELGYWESQPHLWNGQWATLTDTASYAAAVRASLASAVALITSYGATPVLISSPYYGDGTPTAEVDAWNAIVSSVSASAHVADLDLDAVLDPTGVYETTVDGIDARTSDGVHLTVAGVTERIDPWLLPIVERLGLAARQ